ncbi:hypothetical protein GCM10011409_00340 [Lentibacillus populi]|uniref:Abortive phage resistance protein n=1 Tax=Lentibacillus populi TaxID=1827502 RepID=A0A9W5TTH2_9BACI|nr:Abi family protein [Lentibacillus populi]GGB26993.1 hypothetical protein GCM10011409_00340 [Lentibacillus populi]
MEVLEKPFIDLDEQIEKLIARGLEITDHDKARQQLVKTTYYDLINGYKDMFLLPKEEKWHDDKYIQGTKLNDIIDLYELDRQLRNATLEVTLDIECRFYSSMSYSLAKVYGEKEEDYLNKDNYKLGNTQSHNGNYERENLFDALRNKINKPKIQPLIYYKKKYNNIPPWILVKDLTFGELVMLYKLSSKEVKEEVISNILGTTADEKTKELFFVSIKIFNKFRNWAAHGGRMYNYRCRIELPYTEHHANIFGISKEKYIQGNGKNDFASLIIAAMFFLKKDYSYMLEFIVKIRVNLDDYQKTNPIQYENILIELGIPSNYFQSIQRGMMISPLT